MTSNDFERPDEEYPTSSALSGSVSVAGDMVWFQK